MKKEIPNIGDKRFWSRKDFIFAVNRTIKTMRNKSPLKLILADRYEELLNNKNVPKGWRDGVLYLASIMGRVIIKEEKNESF